MRRPLSNFSAGGGFLSFPTEEDNLRTMGAYGYTDEEMDRYALVPLGLSSPLTDSFKQSETIIVTFDEIMARYSYPDIYQDLWSGMRDRFGGGDVVNVPIVAQRTTLGVLGFNTTEHRRWSSQEIAYVEGTCAVLGIWATHPLSGVQTPQIWRPVGEADISSLRSSTRDPTPGGTREIECLDCHGPRVFRQHSQGGDSEGAAGTQGQ